MNYQQMTLFDFAVVLFGVSTLAWLGKLLRRLSAWTPAFAFLSALPIILITFSIVIYWVLRLTVTYPEGFATILVSMDNVLGVMLLASLAFGIAIYGLLPFLEVARDILPQRIATQISLSNPPPTKGIGALFIFVAYILISMLAIGLLGYFRPLLFGSCAARWDVLCLRFSVFSTRFADYVSQVFPVNILLAQSVAVLGGIAAILGVIKAAFEAYTATRKATFEEHDASKLGDTASKPPPSPDQTKRRTKQTPASKG